MTTSNAEEAQQEGREMTTSIVYIRIRSSDKLSELLVDNVEEAELTIESIVGTALLEVLGDVEVENVTVQRCAKRNHGDGGQGSTRRENVMR